MSTRTFFCFTLAVLLFTQLTVAGTTGKIAGKVVDAKTNEPIPFASVVVVGTTLGASSDVGGRYVILNVPPGTYSISANLIGYQGEKVVDIDVSVDFTTTLNFSLKESSVELGEVVVQGERSPLIRQDQTNPVVAVSSENIQSLPVTSISEVIGLQAGVVVDDDGDLHVRGGRSNEIAFTLNGISVNNPYDNLSSIGVATNAVQEVTVSTGTFSAEYGNALSGVVNYVTKEGGPRTSGSIRLLTGDYYTTDQDVFPHVDKYQPFNTSRAEATLGGPTPVNGLAFYASGVFDRNNGYLYGNRIYNPTDMYVTRDNLTKRLVLRDSTGEVLADQSNPGYPAYTDDPRYGSNTSAYYFNPIGRLISYRPVLAFVNGQVTTIQVPSVDRVGGPSGDSALVPLNTSQSYNIQGNVSYSFSPTMKLKYEVVYDNGKSQSPYYYSYRYNPDGRPTDYSEGIVQELDWTHTLSSSMFYTLKLSSTIANDKSYTYPNINDPRYLPAFYQTALPIVGFLTGGVSLSRTFRTTSSYGAKFDMQTELFNEHEVKFGAELRLHKVDYESYTLQFYDVNNPSHIITSFDDVYSDSIQYAARVPDVNSGYINYKKSPTQFSMYIQDKIEIQKSLILNAGLRYEYFDPNALYNPDLSQEISILGNTFVNQNLQPASVKNTLSPRISIAYPITDQGVIRFSYGHFYQLGNLAALYTNNNFRVAGTEPVFGNADVKPQRSIQYEIGLLQGLTPNLRLEVTGFYKDVSDYIFDQIVITADGLIKYQALTNLDYANSRGLTVSLYQRRIPGSIFSSSIDYTFAVAEGNRTEPVEDFFFNEASGKNTETFLVPLSFDRTHVLNSTLNLSDPDDYSVSTVIRLQTGTPYTPSIPASLATQLSQFIQNSAYKPFQWSVDLKAEKYFTFGGLKYSVFILIDNVFDTRNEIAVYSNSGKALYNANQVSDPSEFQEITNRIKRGDVGLVPMSAVTNYYVNPENVSRPRLARFGLSVLF